MLATALTQARLATRELGILESALLAITVAMGGIAAIIVLYLVKSALGINLLPGPSALHDWLYPLVRGL